MSAVILLTSEEQEAMLTRAAEVGASAALGKAGVFVPKTLSARDVADVFGFSSTDPIYDRARKGELPHIDLGGTMRFLPSDVNAYLTSKRVAPIQPGSTALSSDTAPSKLNGAKKGGAR